MGGRYHTTQVDFIGCAGPVVPDAETEEDEEDVLLTLLLTFAPSFPVLSFASEAPKVLAALLELPKDANAPDPRPKADDAPVVGDVMPAPMGLDIELKGLVRFFEGVSFPSFFPAPKPRGESTLPES